MSIGRTTVIPPTTRPTANAGPRRRTPPDGEGPDGRRLDIQGLRAVAVLSVVLYHAGVPHLSGGYVGVDVFFVISGFLITGLLLRTDGGHRLGIAEFYARRSLRILPLATLVLLATLAAGWWWLPATRIEDLSRNATAAGVFALNLLQVHDGQEYLRLEAAPSPVLHFWSLGVEEQFYLVWPVLIGAALMLRRRLRVPRLTLVLLLGGASFAWCLHLTAQSATRAYFDPTARAWELAAGAAIAVTATWWERVPPIAASMVRLLGLAAIGWSIHSFGPTTAFPGWHAAVPVLGSCAVLAAGHAGPGTLLTAESLTAIGEYSYGWYLWHWPVLVIGPFAVGHEFGLRDSLVAVAVALVLARIGYGMVENPVRTSRLRHRPATAVGLGLALAAVAVLGARVVTLVPPHRLATAQATDAGTAPDLAQESEPARQLAAALEQAAQVRAVPRNLTPSLTEARFDAPRTYRDGCHLEVEGTTWPAACERYGTPSSDATVVLFGDSHAAQWFPALERIAENHSWHLVSLTKGACTAADVRIYFDTVKRGYDECVAWRNNVLDRIDALQPAVVVTSFNYDGGTALRPDDSPVPTTDQDRYWADGFARTLHRLTAAADQVVYIDDTPWQEDDVPECLATWPANVPTCVRDRETATAGPRRALFARAATDAGATVVDPAPWFCTESVCPVIFRNILMYQDASHITPQYARLLAPVLRARLAS